LRQGRGNETRSDHGKHGNSNPNIDIGFHFDLAPQLVGRFQPNEEILSAICSDWWGLGRNIDRAEAMWNADSIDRLELTTGSRHRIE